MPLSSRIQSSPLYNEDLAPTTRDRRTWGTYSFAALWVSMSVNILTYMLAASLIQGGMNWKQAVATVFIGNTIVLIPMLLNSHPGARYGIPFPVLARASFGVLGANLAAVLRALVACGWFGIQTWIGGEAINTLIITLVPSWGHIEHSTAISGVLADQSRGHTQRHRIYPLFAGSQRTDSCGSRLFIAGVGLQVCGRIWTYAVCAVTLLKF